MSDDLDSFLRKVEREEAIKRRRMPPRTYFVVEQKQEPKSDGLIVAGYFMALLFPVVGAVIGLITLVKGKIIHGIMIGVLSSLTFLFWLGFYWILLCINTPM